MNKKDLLSLELTEEQANRIIEIVSREQETANINNNELDSLTQQISHKNNEIENLNQEISKISSENQTLTHEFEQYKRDQVINQYLVSINVKDINIVRFLLDLDQIQIDEKGKLQGLDKQIEEIKKTHDYLFNQTLSGRATATNAISPNDTTRYRNNPWNEKSLDLTKQTEIMKENPELAKKLMEQAKNSL